MNSLKENTELQRRCSDCKNIFLLNCDNFHRSKNRLYGFEYKCKSCAKERGRIKNINRRGTGRFKKLSQDKKLQKYEIAKKYYKTKNGRARVTASMYKKTDKSKGLENDIDWVFILTQILDNKCYYCGVINGKLGCDRLDNSKGHIKTNVVPCCELCNKTRLDNYTSKEMKFLGKVISKIRQRRLFSINFNSLEIF